MEKYNKYIDAPAATMVCDLDELKYVNDHYGHQQGDVLIKESAQLLHRYFSRNGIVSRVGGDEFAVILTNVDQSQMERLYEGLSEEIKDFNANSGHVKINMSIGYAFSEHSQGEMESLLIEADGKMYQEKRAKKQQPVV